MEEAGAGWYVRRNVGRPVPLRILLAALICRGLLDLPAPHQGTKLPLEIPLTLADDCLVVFIDDTGHEALVKGHPVYGLGGCAALVRDLNRIIRSPWREVRRQVTGSPDTPLHANSFVGFATDQNIGTVADFFHTQPFARLGAIISFKTKLADQLGAVPTIAKVLQERIREIASRTAFRSIAVIFESSERADRLVEQAFQGFRLQEDGKPLPVECYFMRRSTANRRLKSPISLCTPSGGKPARI
jgi:hypothetical protein